MMESPELHSSRVPRRVSSEPGSMLRLRQGAAHTPSVPHIQTLFVHPDVKIVQFASGGKAALLDIDAARLEAGTLPPYSRLERTIAVGTLSIYRGPGSVAFLNCGSALQPILPKSQCWVIDETNGTFILQIRRPNYWRIELQSQTVETQVLALAFKDVLDKILRFEKTHCPFERSFTIEIPEDASSLVKKKAWTPKHTPITSSYGATTDADTRQPTDRRSLPSALSISETIEDDEKLNHNVRSVLDAGQDLGDPGHLNETTTVYCPASCEHERGSSAKTLPDMLSTGRGSGGGMVGRLVTRAEQNADSSLLHRNGLVYDTVASPENLLSHSTPLNNQLDSSLPNCQVTGSCPLPTKYSPSLATGQMTSCADAPNTNDPEPAHLLGNPEPETGQSLSILHHYETSDWVSQPSSPDSFHSFDSWHSSVPVTVAPIHRVTDDHCSGQSAAPKQHENSQNTLDIGMNLADLDQEQAYLPIFPTSELAGKFTTSLITRTCKLILGPPAYLVTMMVTIAGRISAGEWKGQLLGYAQSGEEIPVSWDCSDGEFSDWDNDE